MKTISIEAMRSAIRYCEKTGDFLLVKNYGKRRVGDKVGSVNKINGYVELSICGEKAYGHRAAWAYFYGFDADSAIDHINGDRSDNRIANLRLATAKLNSHNIRKPNKNNKSGFLGVSFCLTANKWRAQIVSDKPINLGRFDTPEKAHEVYLEAKRRLHVGCTI